MSRLLSPVEGRKAMLGDPKECRLRAMHCAELAASAKAASLKATLLRLSKEWEWLAVSLETTQALLAEGDVDFKDSA
jgi:hypothetical protein